MYVRSNWRAILAGSSTLALLATLPGTAFAQAATSGATELETISVIGEGEAADKSPLTQTTDRETLDQRQVVSFEDFARRVDAGVNYNSSNKSINLRGLGDNRVLTLVDGIRQPWLTDPRDDAKGGVNAYDFDSISALDITKGADSSRYGSGALGGVINIRTLDPEDLIKDGRNFGGIVKSTYDSADESISGSAAAAVRSGDSWFMVQGGYKQGHERDNQGTIGGYEADRTIANPMDFDQGNLLAKFHQYIEGGHRLGLTAELYRRDDDTDNLLGTTSADTGTVLYEPGTLKTGEIVDRQRLSLSYDFLSPDNSDFVDEASVQLYWQKQKLNGTTHGIREIDPRMFAPGGAALFYGPPYGVYSRDNLLEQTAYGLTADASRDLALGELLHTLRFGGEAYLQQTHQYSGGIDNCPDVDWETIAQPYGPQTCRFLHTNASDMPDVDSTVLGFFVEDDIQLMDGRLTLTPGIRFDWFSHDPKSTTAYEDSPNYDPSFLRATDDFGISPKLRLAWKATSDLEVFAQWAQGFRAPSVTELYQNYGAPGSYARIGNPDLKTERSDNFEIGANYSSGDFALSATVFNSYYRDFIDTVTLAPPGGEYPVGGIQGYINRAHVNIFGVELAGRWNITNEWSTWGSLAWTEGRDTDTDEYLNSVAPLRAIIGLGYAKENWGADVSLTAASERNHVSGSGFVAPSYGVFDTTFWWEPAQVEGLKLQAGIYNIFDETYWDAVSVPNGVSDTRRDYYTEAGRSFRVSLTKTF
ncbi:TonB-dependent hemoglobin/transferrin/lactoferrin family receptor [Pseudohoeflea suaedae]|uniref:TonB-dependent hemoglobin/transferrin/lactoferrin family receptor n=1 Tax=Pseudohoeflea suaedae TaxID=877384 RepID=A0A4R5PHV1_9HYPH|nr:TonB-dependent hemoglobin/transferrin/lactoferrin family receptor [Pseudohoeflea suaedae]TDH34412.1 TonB-dependent hemoglobin/transferrin/lactoferrin family receptor [Pseudohoeflea suaedae]